MSASISDKTKGPSLKIITNKQIFEIANNGRLVTNSCIHSISQSRAGSPVQMDNSPSTKKGASVTLESPMFSSKIFPITFSYLKKLCYTKVMKVTYKGGEAIYKVVLLSMVSRGSRVCWLRLHVRGWTILLGQDLEQSLIQAIASAIESQE